MTTEAGEDRLRAALRESEDRFRLMVEGSEQVFFYEHDLDHRFTYLSGSVTRVLGYDPAELMGTPYDDLLLPGPHREETHQRTDEAIRTGVAADAYRAAVYHRDGRRILLEIVERPLVGPDGDVRGVQGFARDITERDRVEAALHRSEEYFRALIEKAPDLVAVIDAVGVARYVSPGFQSVLGHDPDRLEGSSLLELVRPEDLPAMNAALGRLAENPGVVESVDVSVRRADGAWRVLEIRGRNLLDRPAVHGIVLNARDVTEHRLLEARFEQAQKMEAVGRLAGGIAHDFNNVLTAIGGYARFVLDDLSPDHPVREDVAEIVAAADRAAGIVRQLLAFSRRQVTQPVALDLNRVIADIRKMLDHLIGADIDLVLEPEPGIPVVQADRTQIEQVLVNLVVNARDAMPRGGRITIATQVVELDEADARDWPPLRPGLHVVLSVQDTGVGMPPDVLDHLFEPFFTTKKVGIGTGLGLSTAYGIVAQSQGHITCESAVGAGTRFAIWLPAATGAAAEYGQHDDAGRPGTGNGELILVVEDESAVRALARRALVREGYEVIEADDGEHALDMAEAESRTIDLLLTDAIMPGVGGKELARRLAAQRPGLRVLFMSGYAESEIVHRGVLDPGIAFLEKPFTVTDLARTVRRVLDQTP